MYRRQLTLRSVGAALLFGALLPMLASCGTPTAGKSSPALTPFSDSMRPSSSSAIAGAPAFQKAILQDGTVTFDEYQRAVFATIQCAKDHGVKILTGPTLGPGKKYVYTMGGGTTTADLGATQAQYVNCLNQYENLVDIAWTNETRPTQDQVNKARAALITCLQQAGLTVPDSPAPSDFLAISRAHVTEFDTCSQAVSKQFDIFQFNGQ
jgi:hypothetical protein